MTVYGNFEAIKQVFKTTHGSIWSARTAGTTEAPDCCIKLFQLDADMLENRDTTFAQNLLIAAALQQAMANKSEHWAPVYGLGSQGTNAFYVTRLYPRSGQTIIDYKTDLTSAELKVIMLAAIDGLIDLGSAYHRSHGNLKPANVLIADRTKVREGTVVLTDPDPGAEDRPSLTRTPDTKALGELLYGLVTHNPHVTARCPLPKSVKWKQLGSTGKQWFALCGYLLNGVTRRGTPSLEHIRSMVESVHPTPRRFPRSLVALVLIAGLCAAGYARRVEVRDWYHQASVKMVSLVHPTKVVPSHSSSTQPKASPPNDFILGTSDSSPKISTAGLVAPTLGVHDLAPTDLVKPSVSSADNSVKGIAPAIPPAATEPAILANAKPPKSRPIVIPHDDDATQKIALIPAPEFHSVSATDRYNVRRSQFCVSYAGLGSATTLSDWANIYSRLLGLDSDYPLVSSAASAAWPKGLANIVASRRDAALLQAIDGAFDRQRVDPEPYKNALAEVNAVSSSVVGARDALARGDLAAAKKNIDTYNTVLQSFPPGDADMSALFAPLRMEFDTLAKVQASTDRAALLDIADNSGASLGIRLAAWYRAGSIGDSAWPTTIDAWGADQDRADQFEKMLHDAGSDSLIKTVDDTETARRNGYFSRLTTQELVLQELKLTRDPKYAALVAKAPLWFRYDVALYTVRTAGPGVTAEQKKAYSDLASQVAAPGVGLVHDALKTEPGAAPPTLGQSGPGSVKGWTLRSGSTRDRCTFISASRGDTLEFLHVHLPNDPDGVDCYLCTTEVPVALLQHLLNGDANAMSVAEALNSSPTPPAPGMRLWNFNDKTGNVELDNDDYRKCFVVSPSEQLPAQFVTPQLAFYLARRVGCRLPTAREWSAALAQAKFSSDANMRGFASIGWKLRDRQFARLLVNPNRDPACWPDDNIFLPNSQRQIVPRNRSATIWTMTDLRDLGGSATSDTSSGYAWPLSSLEASGGFGFRTVGDDENFAGVFHDLIGNVGEFVMDAPVILEEKVAVPANLPKTQAIQRVTDFFTPEHLLDISVIGGSALSPPSEDPTKPYPLPSGNGPTMFADVGFRLAFTDPASVANAQRAVITQSAYLTAPTK